MVLDERLDAELHGAAPAFGGHVEHAVKPGREGERKQIEKRGADPQGAGWSCARTGCPPTCMSTFAPTGRGFTSSHSSSTSPAWVRPGSRPRLPGSLGGVGVTLAS